MSIQARAQRDSRSAQEQAQGDGVRETPSRPLFAAFVYLTNVMGAVRVGEGGNLFNRLADLIEPEPELTCRMHRDENGMWHCSNCDDLERGGDGIESWCDSWAPDFCPDCGARVVRQ